MTKLKELMLKLLLVTWGALLPLGFILCSHPFIGLSILLSYVVVMNRVARFY